MNNLFYNLRKPIKRSAKPASVKREESVAAKARALFLLQERKKMHFIDKCDAWIKEASRSNEDLHSIALRYGLHVGVAPGIRKQYEELVGELELSTGEYTLFSLSEGELEKCNALALVSKINQSRTSGGPNWSHSNRTGSIRHIWLYFHRTAFKEGQK